MKWFQYVLDHPEKQWDWYGLSMNPNITWEIIEANPEKKWDWQSISWNSMEKNPIHEKRRKERIVARTKLVKEEMMMVFWHPDRYDKWAFDDDE
jgi:hypothetical protein